MPLQPSGPPGRTRAGRTWADAWAPGRPEAGPGLPLAAPASGGPDLEALAVSILDKMSALSTPGSRRAHRLHAPAAPIHGPIVVGSRPAPRPGPGPAGRGAGRADCSTPGRRHGPAASAAGGGRRRRSPRPSDQDLNNLSRWLYPLIRYRLKGELREDRERAGLLTDHYGRW